MTMPMMRFTTRIRSISHPLASGEPLLLLPTCLLVRWRDLTALPEIGAAYHCKTVTVSAENIETVHRILCSPDPLARCDASKHVPLHVLAQLYSYSQAKNMHRVAKSLCPEVRQFLHAGAPASLRRLFRVAYGESPEEQIQRWNELGTDGSSSRSRAPLGPLRQARASGAGVTARVTPEFLEFVSLAPRSSRSSCSRPVPVALPALHDRSPITSDMANLP